jgi:hypothetical protein
MHVLGMSEGPAAAFENEPSIKRTIGRVLLELRPPRADRDQMESYQREKGEIRSPVV